MSRVDEAARQQALLAALRAVQSQDLPPRSQGLRGRSAEPLAGLQAYRANAQAVAERSLAAAYPVLAQLIGDEAMAALARDLWRIDPPVKGDLAWFGAGLAEWLAGIEAFAELPYLPDVARLEWLVHRAQMAADPSDASPDLQPLAGDPDTLQVRFTAGSAPVESAWPVLRLWRAHQTKQDVEPDLTEVRAALVAREGDIAWIWRRGHRVDVAALSTGEHEFHRRLLGGEALGPALSCTLGKHPDFSFEHWLTRALREGWLAGFAGAVPIPT
ncbi:HvfC/BufC family peptide modification chaperone [Ideonella sp. YS5]|uniref:HvfC/BufC family peptide modification chaperone n=1 Tax=Ideonella sp. YS5 TaxID=3453714 RepID=UPI003EEDACFC